MRCPTNSKSSGQTFGGPCTTTDHPCVSTNPRLLTPRLERRHTMWQQVLERIHAEYLEMPDMRLKLEQVQRLCGIERSVCKAVLDSLVNSKFLYVNSDGCYARLADGKVPRLRPSSRPGHSDEREIMT